MRIHPVILGVGMVSSVLWAMDAPMVREIQGVVMACDPDGLLGDGCQRDLGAMAVRFLMGTAGSVVLAVAGGMLLKRARAE